MIPSVNSRIRVPEYIRVSKTPFFKRFILSLASTLFKRAYKKMSVNMSICNYPWLVLSNDDSSSWMFVEEKYWL